MQRLLKLPLIFFFLASCLGLLLRWHYVQPIAGFKYPYWLHAHSHIMFLGWIFNALSMGFVISFLSPSVHFRYTRLFTIINLFVACMMISFPVQGYGAVSIVVSTLHTIVVVWFVFRFFIDTKTTRHIHAVWLARTALVFFSVSAAGPFVLGALMANGLGQTQGYHLAVYYYLHFQYNGVFTFGILALFFRLLDEKGISVADNPVRKFKILMAVACVPAYVLSALWINPGWIFNLFGAIVGFLQLIAFGYFWITLRPILPEIKNKFSPKANVLFLTAGFSFGLKLLLQFISAYPSIAQLAYEVRFYVMTYLHLVLIGMVSFFLVGWYYEKSFVLVMRWSTLTFLIAGFFLSEAILISVMDWPFAFSVNSALAGASLLMVIGIGATGWEGIRNECLRFKSHLIK
jgi:hypothetical protein